MTKEQREDLEHACTNGRFMTSKTDENMTALVELGFMRGPISAGFLHKDDAYFIPTREGREALS